MSDYGIVDRDLAMEAVRVTEAAALAASRYMGRGNEEAADTAAVDAMEEALGSVAIDGTIRIGAHNGGRETKLAPGTKVGNETGLKVDVALLPLEGPTIIARGEPNGLSVIAMAEEGGFLDVPDIYMDKIAVGRGLPDGVVDLDAEPADNLKALAEAKGVDVRDLVVCTLDRPRHKDLIAKTREAGARILLLGDGDVSGIVATSQSENTVDMFMGVGDAPQGILAAAALSCIGGQMQARLVFRNDDEKAIARACGIEDLERKYGLADMVTGNVTFAATGVTAGAMLAGVRSRHGWAVTHSMVMRSKSGTLRFIEAHHNFADEALSGPIGN
jgi:fructose-1,6-bisphosphatase II / sedoheptulose-1,7-bisphosphatase